MHSSDIMFLVLGLALLVFLGFAVHGCQEVGKECAKAGNEWRGGDCFVRQE